MFSWIQAIFTTLKDVKEMVMNVHELVEWSRKVEAWLMEVYAELMERIMVLEEALAGNGELSDDVRTALTSLSEWADRLANVVPNAPIDSVDPPDDPDSIV